MGIDLSDYVAGGYFVLKYGNQLPYASDTGLLPEKLISISPCISEKLEVFWGWNLEQYPHVKHNFGILHEKYAAFHEWSITADADSYGIYNISDARYAISEFFPTDPDILLIGVGLHHELVDDFLTYKPYPDEHPNYVLFESPDSDNFRKNTLKDHFVNKKVALEIEGNILGFELMSFFGAWSHSWLCSGLEKDMHELFGIRPNQHGLIDSYEDAKKVHDWIAEDKMQGTRSEPEPYYPWLIVQYPLS
jgi:hypothetical protein